MEYTQEELEKFAKQIENKRESSKSWYKNNKGRALELAKKWKERNREIDHQLHLVVVDVKKRELDSGLGSLNTRL